MAGAAGQTGAMSLPVERLTARVCVAGGGPAGMMLGLLLARAGIDVLVLEKHEDFFRDFRGDTVHPSTLDLIDQLGFRDKLEAIPHTRLRTLDIVVGSMRLHPIDFGRLRGTNREVAMMPQWDLLDLLAAEGRRCADFRLVMGAEVINVVRTAGRVTGVVARTDDGEIHVDATFTVAADGRRSTVRDRLRLVADETGVPIDVLWLRLPRPTVLLPDTLAYIRADTMVVTIPRPDYLQCGVLIPKGTFDDIKAVGLPAFRERIARCAPPLSEGVDALADWDAVKLLTVQVDMLPRWSVPGALCIGDAAHAMSPALGVGINYAIQDAVAAANRLVPVLRSRPDDDAALDDAARQVQRRRRRPTALMQRIQIAAHRFLRSGRELVHDPPNRFERTVPSAVLTALRPVTARFIGYGFRPERINDEVLSSPPP
jgi:2-polyprenyl-6-methoxyphenol hydroxylase-like FAD-dependent oxidoreductase